MIKATPSKCCTTCDYSACVTMVTKDYTFNCLPGSA